MADFDAFADFGDFDAFDDFGDDLRRAIAESMKPASGKSAKPPSKKVFQSAQDSLSVREKRDLERALEESAELAFAIEESERESLRKASEKAASAEIPWSAYAGRASSSACAADPEFREMFLEAMGGFSPQDSLPVRKTPEAEVINQLRKALLEADIRYTNLDASMSRALNLERADVEKYRKAYEDAQRQIEMLEHQVKILLAKSSAA